MDGVIIFADDHIFESTRFEGKLFQHFNNKCKFSTLPIDNLLSLERTVSSISTYKALILDWNFNRKADEDDDVKISDETPYEFLKQKRVYSLIYVYSQANIDPQQKKDLETLYPNKIFFEVKKTGEEVEREYNKIVQGIENFGMQNTHLTIPFIWSQSINRSAQIIFDELERADKYWIKDLYYSSVIKVDKDGNAKIPPPVDPNIQVINLFQNLLGEKLIQDASLQKNIEQYSKENFKNESDINSLQALYKRLYYTRLLETDTIMTGDVFELSDEKYGVVLSPECDMNTLIKNNSKVEVLCFSKSAFLNIKNIVGAIKTDDDIKRAYNQEHSRIHLLPVFPISDTENITCLIDFRFGLEHYDGKYLEEKKEFRKIKINSPYIQQLRQRYLAYIGRVGVPAIPDSLRNLT